MEIVGSYDRVVGILYALAPSVQNKEDLWFTDADFTFYIGPITDNKYVTVPKGFQTDGASVPRMFWSIFPPWGIYGQAAIVHDYLCVSRKLTSYGQEPIRLLMQKEIDDIFYAAMKVAGTPIWKRAIIYGAVRLFHNLGL
jgi:hypothetical protein